MPYIGNTIRAADDYRLIDDISSGFNGSETSFALQVAGSAPVPFPKSPQQVLISVNGVIQEPDPTGASGFNLVGTNIVFSSAPTNGHAFFGIIYATADYLNSGGNFPTGSLGAPSITFVGDEDTGIYRKGSGSVAFVSNSTEIANTDSNGLTISSGNLIIPDSIIHGGDSDTKIRFPAANTFSVETGGVERMRSGSENVFNETGVDMDFRVEGDTDANLLFGDASTDRIGIGTSSPDTKFHLSGDKPKLRLESTNTLEASAGTEEIARIEFEGTKGSNINVAASMRVRQDGTWSTTDDFFSPTAIEFYTQDQSGTEITTPRLTIDKSGNVNIGTQTAIGKLTIRGANSSGSAAYGVTNSGKASEGIDVGCTTVGDGNFGGAISFGCGGNGRSGIAAVQYGSDDDRNGLVFLTHASVAGSDNAIERMRIHADGQVGIGTASPTSKLYVNGVSTDHVITAAIADDNGNSIINILAAGTTGNSRILFSDTAANDGIISYSHNDRALVFGTAGTSEDLRLDSSGRLLIGNNGHLSNGGIESHLQVIGTGTDDSSITMSRFSNDVHSAYLVFSKSRNGSIGGNTIVQNNDSIGRMTFFGNDGTDNNTPAAEIDIEVDGTPGSNDMPGRFIFRTTADGASTTSERLRIDSNGFCQQPFKYQLTVSRSSNLSGYDANGSFGTALIFNNIVQENKDGALSSCFDTSTGLFTVPVEGIYFLEASAYSAGSTFSQAWFVVSGSRANYSDWVMGDPGGVVNSNNMRKLSAGATVGFHPHGGGGQTSITINQSANHTWMRITFIG